MAFYYGADQMRYKQVKSTADGSETTIYIDKLFEKVTRGTTVEHRHYVGDFAIIKDTVQSGTTSSTIAYLHKDRLGSTTAEAGPAGQMIGAYSYDPFGRPRDGQLVEQDGVNSLFSKRGFTDHEHMNEMELIHMNGRVYDFHLGRFMSVDPVIQYEGNSQSINPYSYIMNNPLSGTDPSGYESEAERERNLGKKAACEGRSTGCSSVQIDAPGSNGKGTTPSKSGAGDAPGDVGSASDRTEVGAGAGETPLGTGGAEASSEPRNGGSGRSVSLETSDQDSFKPQQSTPVDLITHASEELRDLPTTRGTKEITVRFERDELGKVVTVDRQVQGRIRPGTDIIESKIKNTRGTVAFGHTHPRGSRSGIGPEDKGAPTLTGKPSFIRGSRGRIYLVENVDNNITVIELNR